MKKNIFIKALFIFTAFQPLTSVAQLSNADSDKKYLYERPAKIPLRSAFIENETSGDWDLTYNRLEFNIDPAICYIKGKVFFEFTSLVDNLRSITIDLDDSLTITSVSSAAQSCTYSRENGFVRINIPSTLNKSETGSFTVAYEGRPKSTGLGAFTQGTHQDVPVIFTLSEPYGAKEWWPCKESLSDKIDSLDLFIETPSPYRSASNGRLVSDTVSNLKRVCHWKHRHPISTYLVFFSTTNYEIYSDWAKLEDGTNVEILNYVYPESLETAKLNTPYTVDFMKFFSKKFIDYPFKNEKYGHAQFGWDGGMEHQTMSSVGAFIPNLLAHELAHQWFGDYITCGNWNEVWLNEGFATYLTALVVEAFNPDSWKRWKSDDIAYITSKPDGSVYVDDLSDINRMFDSRLTYEKGAFVLHMLRGQIGDDAFYAGMKRYLKDPRAINGFTSTDIYRENMELAADTTLTEFFADWIKGEGYPVYDIEWNYSDQQIQLDIYQQPSTPNGPFFEMKLPVTIYSKGNEKTYWLANTLQGQHFTMQSTVAPDSVKFNKDGWILCSEGNIHTSLKSMNTSGARVEYHAFQKSVTVTIPTVESARYSIYDVQGRLAQSGLWNKSNRVIGVENLIPGVYILHISTSQKKYNFRFCSE